MSGDDADATDAGSVSGSSDGDADGSSDDLPELTGGSLSDFGSAYRLLSGAIVPRPIAWVSSRSTDGVDNLAPFSFYNAVSTDPPVIMFSPFGTEEDPKDTRRNVRETGEFVVHVVTEDVAEAMNETSATLPHGESEFEHADLTPVPAERVDAARVAEAKVAFECTLFDTVRIGDWTMVLGEVVYAHVADDLLTDEGKLDVQELDAVGRLAGNWYARTTDRFELERPP